MKKFFKISCICLLLFVFSFIFLACTSIEQLVSANVSEYRENYYFAQREGYNVSFTDGRRERDFVMDGHKTDLVEYGVIVLRTSQKLGENPEYELNVNGQIYTGTMEINPFDMTYVADIEKVIGKDKEIIFSLPNSNFSLPLVCLSSSWKVTCSRALDIFTQAKKAQVIKFFEAPAEVYVKIVASKDNPNDIFFYVLCVNNAGDTLSALIDVHTGDIIQN